MSYIVSYPSIQLQINNKVVINNKIKLHMTYKYPDPINGLKYEISQVLYQNAGMYNLSPELVIHLPLLYDENATRAPSYHLLKGMKELTKSFPTLGITTLTENIAEINYELIMDGANDYYSNQPYGSIDIGNKRIKEMNSEFGIVLKNTIIPQHLFNQIRSDWNTIRLNGLRCFESICGDILITGDSYKCVRLKI